MPYIDEDIIFDKNNSLKNPGKFEYDIWKKLNNVGGFQDPVESLKETRKLYYKLIDIRLQRVNNKAIIAQTKSSNFLARVGIGATIILAGIGIRATIVFSK